MSDNVEERAPASPSVDYREGGVVLWLLRNPHKWVHRRWPLIGALTFL